MDTESFKREFLPYHRKLYCVAYRLLENAADAEDLVQEAYLKLWDKREGLSVISNPEAFSVTLVKNMCFDCFVQESMFCPDKAWSYQPPKMFFNRTIWKHVKGYDK